MQAIELKFTVDGKDFTACGQAAEQVKRTLKQIGIPPDITRKVAIAMYEGEVNMVIHANGGFIDAIISEGSIEIVLKDTGPGIPDINKAMQEGFSTATENIRQLGFGAGMGLPNMKKYSDRMTIDSVVGKGTTVKLGINF